MAKGREKPQGDGRQPRIRSGWKRFVYATERSDEGVTGFAGLAVLMEAFHALGVAQACREHVRCKVRRRGPTEAQWVEAAVMLHLAGGQRVEDLEVLKQDDGLSASRRMARAGADVAALAAGLSGAL
jgi:hypothetical protein